MRAAAAGYKTDKKVRMKKAGARGGMPCWAWAFLINLAVALAAVAPSIIGNNGYMAMSHDFSAQEITFNMLMNDTVKSGNLLWNWGIDLGSNFLEAFSFYNVGSIFFWFTLLFPAGYMTRVMGWMIILKYAVAGAASAAYFGRHIKNKTLVIFASLLYAFSGFQCSTVVFYHFQDQAALFPLLLIGLELLVEEKKRGRLAIACVLNLLSNYVFFVGEILFLVAYYVFRYLVPQIKAKGRTFREYARPILDCMLEGIIGISAAGVILVPAVYGTLANSRISSHITGDAWLTMTSRDWLLLLKAVLVPAEAMNSTSSITGADWMSNAAYLPMAGLVLVLAYMFTKKDWISGMLKLGMVVAAVPVLNSVFMFFNVAPYRRWYYMVILIMALASAKVLERTDEYRIRAAAACTAFLYGIYWIMLNVAKWDAYGTELVLRRKWYYFGMAVGIGGTIATLVVVKWVRKSLCSRVMCALTALFSCLVLTATVYEYGATTDNTGLDFKVFEDTYGESVDHYLTEIPRMLDRDVLPYRYYFDEWIGHTYYNLAMANSLPSINSFISTVHPSIMEFYDLLGPGRLTWTNAENTGTRELLSARYVVSAARQPEYEYLSELTNSNGQTMYLYENTDALPMGFTYDHFIARSEFEALDLALRPGAMLGTLVVRDEDAEKAAEVIPHAPEAFLADLSQEQRKEFISQRKKEASTSFVQGDNFFEAHITAGSDKYAFFSVPYDKCWNAEVNGQEQEILNINGLMAVRVSEGENVISFRYEYAPLKYGILLSVIGAAAYAVYLAAAWRGKRKNG